MKDIQHIGPAIKARRQARGWSQAALCEAAGNAINTSTLSTTENGMSLPNVMAAYAVAKALGTTVEALIEEANNPGAVRSPKENAERVPVVPWHMAAEWKLNPDITRLPANTPWVLPPENATPGMFALVVPDDTMHSPSGLAFPAGSTIFVNPRRVAEANDLVVGYTHKGEELTFKRLIQDGAQRYLRPLNPQFPMVSIDGNFQVVGVVTGMRMIIEKGVIR
ncbi:MULTISPECIES: LexA family protein [Pseudomonas]|uniref:LexA repressor n=2 Tax=Pseudomonas aeruginosa TaxID=287 RepID=A0A9P1RCT9_PSEAI|nr:MULTISPECIES: S24 family peptidase [Pseudomonas]EKY0077901.1 helix-turn-helix domain-containing protein [Pseudomonas aeruginosa]KSQ01985.1 hypothetical protein APB25_26480 [Pseudomonas aeruginosa]KSS84042.1 hypothetical protein APB72_26885 [Pseudomonas aeruginosa]MBM2631740.1 helix-turn-helix domain-containing protein [Pseudomonas aeruginosa]MBM2644371.1 helix-turn-helix domain-containing protein [Pseudomonas aeruginosa]